MKDTLPSARADQRRRALLLFELFKDAMRAEHLLKKAGFDVKTGAPPPEVRTGCDLAVGVLSPRLSDAEKRLTGDGVPILDVVFAPEAEIQPLQLTKLIKEVDFGTFLMVRCGNMKITVNKETGLIVNISGGGCPDIPFIGLKIVGNTLETAPRPMAIGTTLCAYALQKAFERAYEKWKVS